MKQHLFRRVLMRACPVVLLLAVILLTIGGCSDDNSVEPVRPDLVVWPQSVSVSMAYDGMPPSSVRIKVDCSPHGNLPFQFEESCSWIELSRPDGALEAITLDSFAIFFDASDVPVGVHVDTVTVRSSETNNSPQYVEVTLTVGPQLTFSPSTMSFTSTPDALNPAPDTLSIESNDGQSFQYALESTAPWLVPARSSGYTPDNVEITVDISEAELGVQVCTLAITSDDFVNTPRYVTCTLSLPPWGLQTSPMPFPLEDVVFVDELTGWAVGYIPDFDCYHGYIIGTSDGGQTWETIRTITAAKDQYYGLSAIECQGDNLWAIGQSGIILFSPDRGDTWQNQSTGLADTVVELADVCFASPTAGWIVGEDGLILATADGGATWSPQPSGTSFYLSCVDFADELTGWIAGGGSFVLHTSDGGTTWNVLTTGIAANDYLGIYFADANNGWVVGKLGAIIYTPDGGSSWTLQPSGVTGRLNSAFFVDNLTGWVVGEDGVILTTTDGGSNWEEQLSPTSAWLKSVTFADPNNGWAVGSNGVVISTNWGDY